MSRARPTSLQARLPPSLSPGGPRPAPVGGSPPTCPGNGFHKRQGPQVAGSRSWPLKDVTGMMWESYRTARTGLGRPRGRGPRAPEEPGSQSSRSAPSKSPHGGRFSIFVFLGSRVRSRKKERPCLGDSVTRMTLGHGTSVDVPTQIARGGPGAPGEWESFPGEPFPPRRCPFPGESN